MNTKVASFSESVMSKDYDVTMLWMRLRILETPVFRRLVVVTQ